MPMNTAGNRLLKVLSDLWSQLFSYALFNDAVASCDYIASNGKMINEWWIGKNVEGSGHAIFQHLAFAWMDWWKFWKWSLSILSVSGEIRSRHLANTSQEPYRLIHLAVCRHVTLNSLNNASNQIGFYFGIGSNNFLSYGTAWAMMQNVRCLRRK
jgi:hypothetical protein